MAAASDRVTFVGSPAHDVENTQNPLPWRARRVAAWLEGATTRVPELRRLPRGLCGIRTRGCFCDDGRPSARTRPPARGRLACPDRGRADAGQGGRFMSRIIVDPVELRRRGFEAL